MKTTERQLPAHLASTCMIQCRRELGVIGGNLAEESNDQLSKRMSLQSSDLITESNKTPLAPGALGEEKQSALAGSIYQPPAPQCWGSHFISAALQPEAGLVTVSVSSSPIHYSPYKSVGIILVENRGLGRGS